MDVAIITGAHTQIGQSVSRRLVKMGWKVFGFGQGFEVTSFKHLDFSQIECSLLDHEGLEDAVNKIIQTKQVVNLYIHVASNSSDVGFEEASPTIVKDSIFPNFYTPAQVIKSILPELIRFRGRFIYIHDNFNEKSKSKNALEYASQKALAVFADSLFDEVRDTGVRVTNIQMDAGADGLDSRSVKAPQSVIDPLLLADAVESIIKFADGNIITELTLRPQATREEPKLPREMPVVNAYPEILLPSLEKRPPLQKPIHTPLPDSDKGPSGFEREEWRLAMLEEEKMFREIEQSIELEEKTIARLDQPTQRQTVEESNASVTQSGSEVRENKNKRKNRNRRNKKKKNRESDTQGAGDEVIASTVSNLDQETSGSPTSEKQSSNQDASPKEASPAPQSIEAPKEKPIYIIKKKDKTVAEDHSKPENAPSVVVKEDVVVLPVQKSGLTNSEESGTALEKKPQSTGIKQISKKKVAKKAKKKAVAKKVGSKPKPKAKKKTAIKKIAEKSDS